MLFSLTSTNSRLWINALSLNAPVSISRIDALLMVTLKIVMAQKAFLRITFVQMSSMRISATADGNTAVGNSVILTLWNIICTEELEIEITNIIADTVPTRQVGNRQTLEHFSLRQRGKEMCRTLKCILLFFFLNGTIISND